MKILFCLTTTLFVFAWLPATAADAPNAGTLYLTNCASCHGDDGTGPRTPDYNGTMLIENAFVRSRSDDELLAFLKVGRAENAPDSQLHALMPAFDTLPEADLRALVGFLRELAGQN